MAFSETPITEVSTPLFREVRHGFDKEQVRAHLARLANQIQDLESRLRQKDAELQEARREAEKAAAAAVPSLEAGVSTRIADLLRNFDQEVARFRDDAQSEAERIKTDAHAQAEKELEEARLEADRLRSEADQMRSEVLELRSSMLGELGTVRDHLLNSLTELQMALKSGSPNEASEDSIVVLPEAADQAPASLEPPTNTGTPSRIS